MTRRRFAAASLVIICAFALSVGAQRNKEASAALSPESLREWLTYISSDDLEGRDTFSEGLGLAAAYIAERLKESGVTPAGDHGSYFQRVAVLSVRSSNHSTVTVEVNGQARTFSDGAGVTFPKNVGGKRSLVLNNVEFVGYGLNRGPGQNDYEGHDVKGHAVVWIGARGPRSLSPDQASRLLYSRPSIATEEMEAAASLSTQESYGTGYDGADFVTTRRLDAPLPPTVTVGDEFLEFLFSAASVKYAELKQMSARQDALPAVSLKGVKLTFNLDADYQVIRTQYTRNVVGVVEGADNGLKDTYVAFGAHYDHLGYSQQTGARTIDVISNGADDDGSGTSTLIGLARAFALGPRPRRSLLFIWHAGEEKGLFGSRYFADYPTVPLDKIVAQLNMDMIGRNRNNLGSESNILYPVGADRISTELHNILVDANGSLQQPLTMDFEMNDPTDPERIYYRSDHYSYAAYGIPAIFFFTGLHQDYHQVTDSIEKIDFDKLSRIGQLIYETGRRVADLDHAPVRDFKGPRAGKNTGGKLPLN